MTLLLPFLTQKRPAIPVVIPDPEPPDSEQLSEIHTASELEFWRANWESGQSFRGDRARIIQHSNELKSNPSMEDYNGPTASPVLQHSTPEPSTQGIRMVSTAWRAIVGNKVGGVWSPDQSCINAVKIAVLNAISKAGMDPTNTAKWQFGILIDVNPGFSAAEYINRVMIAYIFLKSYFTVPQQTAIETWFQNWADWFSVDLNNTLNNLFVDRWNGNYTEKGNRGSHFQNKYTHDNGYTVRTLQVFYNNRRGAIAKFIAYNAILRNNATNKKTARLFYEECIKYGMWPNGMYSDMYRGWNFPPTSDNSTAWETGLSYCVAQAAVLGEIADIFARNGDLSLYNYSTKAGLHGTESATIKNLWTGANIYLKMFAREVNITVNGHLLDGERANWKSAQDLMFSKFNLFWKNTWVPQVYRRQLPGQNPIPTSPAGNGPIPANMGTGGLVAGFCIMYDGSPAYPYPLPLT